MPWDFPLKSLLIIIQMIIIALIAFLMTRPVVYADAGDKDTIFILDASASMRAESGYSGFATRFDRAKRQIKDEAVAVTNANKSVALIFAGTQAVTLIEPTSSASDLNTRLDREDIVPSYGSCDIDGALRAAGDIMDTMQSADVRVLMYTDKEHYAVLSDKGKYGGSYPAGTKAVDPDDELKEGTQVYGATLGNSSQAERDKQYINVSHNSEWNVGIMDLSVRLLGGYYAFVADIGVYGASAPRDFVVTLSVLQGVLAPDLTEIPQDFKRTIRIADAEPGKVHRVTFHKAASVEAGGWVESDTKQIMYFHTAEVSVEAYNKTKDGYSYDDSMWWYGAERKLKVQIASSTGYSNQDRPPELSFIENVFLNMRNVELYMPRWSDRPGGGFFEEQNQIHMSGYDLYIWDRLFPDRPPVDGSSWYIIGGESGLLPMDEVTGGYAAYRTPQGIGLTFGAESAVDFAVGSTPNNEGVPVANKFPGKPLAAANLDNELMDTLLRNVKLSEVYVTQYRNISPLPERPEGTNPDDYYTTVATIDGGKPAMVVKGGASTGRTIVTLFDMQFSSLPIQFVDFTALLNNIIKLTAPPVIEKTVYGVGDVVTINPLYNTKEISVTSYPDGKESSAETDTKAYDKNQPSMPFVFTAFNPGLHNIKVTFDSASKPAVTASIFVRIDPSESDFATNGKALYVQTFGNNSGTKPETPPTQLFLYFALGLLALLLIEWWVHYREQF